MYSKEQWEIDRENRIKAEIAGMDALTKDQLDAITEAREALRSFCDQWAESFNLCDIDTPRDLISAFRKIDRFFHLYDNDV